MITYQKWIRRADLKKHPETLYVFGDNTIRMGLGGQAKEMRGESNAFGIATKRRPGTDPGDYFCDDSPLDAMILVKDIGALFHHIETTKRKVIVPTDGLGTGLSHLPEKAPRLYRLLYESFVFVSSKEDPCPWTRPINMPQPTFSSYKP